MAKMPVAEKGATVTATLEGAVYVTAPEVAPMIATVTQLAAMGSPAPPALAVTMAILVCPLPRVMVQWRQEI